MVAALIILTGIVGGLFIVLGPQATEKSPGVVHVGIRYVDERSLEFNKYGKTGPGATIELVNAEGTVAYTHENLNIGRNLMPLQGLPDGLYAARLSAPGYKTREVPVIVEGRMLNPPEDAMFEKGTHAAYNMIGIWFDPKED